MAINLDDVRSRLAALVVGGEKLRTVQDMVNAAVAMETAVRTPSAFVATSQERAEPNRTQGVHDQRVTQTVAVLTVLAAERAAQDLPDAVEAWRDAITRELAGWTPAGARGAFDYAGFQVLRMGQGLVWFECSFTTSWHLRI